ncbi:MAG: response regulator [Candidatus Saccharimonadales bacterium]|nr:response regulator [Candidatus Saccharimonadales bacterium]
MTKIMLVEDDNNLREIYGARLMAEGFEIVSAADGEEALALAVKQKPDLIISDVMMPKISGFDMLDILRTTPETKNTKVIMMTALSQPEDRKRGEALGADKYLVKSQVTLEDVVTSVHDVLGDGVPAGASVDDDDAGSMVPPVVDTPDPADDTPSDEPVTEKPEETETETAEAAAPAEPAEPADDAKAEPTPVTPDEPEPPAEEASEPETEGETPEDPTEAPEPEEEPEPTAEDEAPSRKTKVLEPINDLNAEPDIIQLAKEEALREQQAMPGAVTPSPSTSEGATVASAKPAEESPPPQADTGMSESIADEKKELEQQIKEFVETSEMVNGEPPAQVEPEEEPDVGDPNYQPPVAEGDVVQVGEPPADDADEPAVVPKADPTSPPPPADLPEESPEPLPEPPPEPSPSPEEPLPEPPPEPSPPSKAPEPPKAPTPPPPPETPIPEVAKGKISPDEVAL